MSLNEIISLALRKNWFYPSAEIYASRPAGFFDYSAEGLKIRDNITKTWRRMLVEKEGFIEVSGSVVLPKEVFVASGHLDNFNDPLIECSECDAVHRADHLIRRATNKVIPENLSVNEIEGLIKEHKIKCEKCDSYLVNEVKKFSLMLKTNVGNGEKNEAFLRPETCQNIFSTFPRLYKNSRQELPLGISQVGKSFRNEIAPRNYLIRERELHQLETEIFFNPRKINELPDEKWNFVKEKKLNLVKADSEKTESLSFEELLDKKIVSGKLIAYHMALLQEFFLALSIPFKKTRFRELNKDEKPFYSKETFDFEVQSENGFIELVACNYRTDYDLKSHEKQSKQKLSVKEEGNEFTPHVFELSIGLDRTFLMVLENVFRKEKRGPEERIFMSFPLSLAPQLVGVFPLVKKDGLKELAFEIHEELQKMGLDSLFDEKGSIGKRYARIDEDGVPFGVTVDYDSLKDQTVTLRERDSMSQKRILIKELSHTLMKLERNLINFKGL